MATVRPRRLDKLPKVTQLEKAREGESVVCTLEAVLSAENRWSLPLNPHHLMLLNDTDSGDGRMPHTFHELYRVFSLFST